MSLETDIKAALSALAGGQVYPDEAPPEVVAPYIVWNEVVSTPENTLDAPSAWHTRLQVDVFAVTRLAADALAVQVMDALTVAPVKAIVVSQQRFTEDVVGLKRTVVDFSIWH